MLSRSSAVPGSSSACAGPISQRPHGHWICAREADGHDAALLCSIRYTLFRDCLDRVFACERYAMRFGNDDADLDLLNDQTSERTCLAAFPRRFRSFGSAGPSLES